MMNTAIFWLYLTNAVLLIDHEIDSAYWHEWELFKLPGGINGFLIIHIPMLFLMLYGLIEVRMGGFAGLVFSLILAAGGIFAFFIHRYFIKKGHPEFTTATSQIILYMIGAVSVIEAILTIYRIIELTPLS